MRYDHLGERHIDECGEKYWEVGGDEVEDKDLLDHGCFMSYIMLENLRAILCFNSPSCVS